ncbi:hypothetical protein ONZ45_g16976 [Pleurotus djamor]|nr:hypothetical protein ONZ45_g16976 [Pleurotus djamor]
MSLDSFQARYTSEDNSSFTQILDDENRKRKEKWGEKMLIEGPSVTGVRERFVIEAPKPAGLITDKAEGEGESGEKETGSEEVDDKGEGSSTSTSLVKVESTEVVDVMAKKKDTRAAGVDGWKFKARNSLMFPPDADQSPYHQTNAGAKPDPKVVLHGNTRLAEQEVTTNASRGHSAPPSPTRSRIDAAISGTPYRPHSPPGTFSLVPDLPSPTPEELGPSAIKELMTWGTLNATPRIISTTDDDIPTPSTPFRISAPSHRESLSHKLSNDAARSLRAKAGLLNGGRTPISGSGSKRPMSALGASLRAGSMAPPSWTPQRNAERNPGGLTPAAKRLLDRTTMGTAAARRADAMSRTAGWEGKGQDTRKDLDKVRWTPTPSPVSRRMQ